jgi:hypothetical protein
MKTEYIIQKSGYIDLNSKKKYGEKFVKTLERDLAASQTKQVSQLLFNLKGVPRITLK